ncbi:helix-turn-helix domain-containing protein [Caulifigura coniformis]|uniref:helix-turn-helix domain-containing protein n=1 Tax=Caulifigura coniformis TaxID=2527983 RepID=UPI0018D2633C
MEALLEKAEVCKALRCSESHIDRERRAGRLVSVRLGRRVLFEPEELRRYVAAQRELATGELS